ncbi:hypothetical protein [uncultured Megasphaera sp.]|jgi:argininosuccinate synthase|uniref:hypothetical protein n=1 Tax=uncultured Megasphaera sp. TaxID=165188 RepID=UPI00258BEB50|nr:hypothetical protein [uncultured Megasphaera sp.]
MDKKRELELLKVRDEMEKRFVLSKLEEALAAANVYVFMKFDPETEIVHVQFESGNKMAVNVAMDNPMAMMYDIFKAAGKRFIEEA